MQRNKNGIPIYATTSKDKPKPNKNRTRNRNIHKIQKLNFNEFAVFKQYQYGVEILITVPSFSPLLRTLEKDGWRLVKVTKDEVI